MQQSVNRSVNAGQTAATLKVNDLRGSLQTFQQFSVVITPRQDHCSRLQSALFAASAVLKADRQTDMQYLVNTVCCCLPGPPPAPSSWRLKADMPNRLSLTHEEVHLLLQRLSFLTAESYQTHDFTIILLLLIIIIIIIIIIICIIISAVICRALHLETIEP